MAKNNFKAIITGVIILVVILVLVIFAVLVLSRPAQHYTTSPVYAECDGKTFNLNQTPLACGTVASGMNNCQSTFTTNGMEIINNTQIPENQKCPS